MKRLMVLTMLALAGCVTVKQVPLPQGKSGYTVSNCRDMAACYRKAAQICGGNYEIFTPPPSNRVEVLTGNSVFQGQYAITVTCASKS
jgi:hypothetical protein